MASYIPTCEVIETINMTEPGLSVRSAHQFMMALNFLQNDYVLRDGTFTTLFAALPGSITNIFGTFDHSDRQTRICFSDPSRHGGTNMMPTFARLSGDNANRLWYELMCAHMGWSTQRETMMGLRDMSASQVSELALYKSNLMSRDMDVSRVMHGVWKKTRLGGRKRRATGRNFHWNLIKPAGAIEYLADM